MSKKVNEGQTQVYMDKSIEPQIGLNTQAPYLNNPPKQLMDIVDVLFKQSHKTSLNPRAGKVISEGGMDEAQILSVLVGMGTPQQLALSAIEKYKSGLGMYTEKLNKQKNDNKMNFTLATLYENVVKCIDNLKVMESDNSRVSYSVKNALTILENSLQSFPMRFKDEDVSVISEDIENTVNPTLKYKVAKSLHSQLATLDWVNPVNELRKYIQDVYESQKWSFRVSDAISRVSMQRGKMFESLSEDLTKLLNEDASSIKNKFSLITQNHPWSNDCKVILSEMAQEDKKATSNNSGKVERVFSPVLESDGGHIFHLRGKNYLLKENKITEAEVKDPRFYDVLEGLKFFSVSGDSLVTFGESNKTLEYHINEGTLKLGETDLSNSSTIELKEALIATNFFGYRNQWKADKICKFFESIDLLYEMDNFTDITSTDFMNLFLTVISVEEGIWVNKVNFGMQMNEMKFYKTATEAVENIKEFINYDASTLFSEKLVAEGNERAVAEKHREEINDKITFLEEKKKEVLAAIDSIGESEELSDAVKLIDEEMAKFEKELADSYSVVEKKTKDEYLDDGYVEARIIRSTAGFKRGEEVLVNAEEYTSLGDDDLLNVIDLKTYKNKIIPKSSIKVDL